MVNGRAKKKGWRRRNPAHKKSLKTDSRKSAFRLVVYLLCFGTFVGVAANGSVRQHELQAVQLVYLAGTWIIVNGGDI